MKRNGSTLIELLVVIMILGILASAAVVAFNPLKRQKQARDARRKQDITAIAGALASYSTLKGHSPAENDCDTSLGETNSDPTHTCNNVGNYADNNPLYVWENTGDDWIYQNLITDKDLIKRLPLDPINNPTYFYSYEPAPPNVVSGLCKTRNIGCGSYWIGALLEAPENPAKAIYRCSDNSLLAEGVGCKEVTGTAIPNSEIVP